MAVTLTLVSAAAQILVYRAEFDGTTGTGTSATKSNADLLTDMATGKLKDQWTPTRASDDAAREALMALGPNGTIAFPNPYQGVSPNVDTPRDGSDKPTLVVDFANAQSVASKAFATLYTFK